MFRCLWECSPLLTRLLVFYANLAFIPVVSSQSCDLPENDNNKNSLIIKLQFLIIYNEIVFLSFLYLTFPSLNCLQTGKVFCDVKCKHLTVLVRCSVTNVPFLAVASDDRSFIFFSQNSIF